MVNLLWYSGVEKFEYLIKYWNPSQHHYGLNLLQGSRIALTYQDFPFIVSTLCTVAQTPYRSAFGCNADQDSGLSFCILHVCRSAGCLPGWAQLSAGTEPRITLGTETERQRAGSQGRYWRIRIAFSWSIRTCYNSDMAHRQMPSHCGIQCSISICFTHCSNILWVFVGIIRA